MKGWVHYRMNCFRCLYLEIGYVLTSGGKKTYLKCGLSIFYYLSGLSVGGLLVDKCRKVSCVLFYSCIF